MATVKVDVRFSDNVAELKERIAAGTGTIEVMKQSVDRAAASIGGQGLFMQANKLTAAIDQVGGVTKLTSSEIDRHSATIDKAIEKYQVMGMTAPPAMVELSKSLKDASDAAKNAGEHTDGFFSGMVAHIAEGILIRDAVHEILGALKEMILALPEMAMEGSHIAAVQHGFELLAGSTKNADDIMRAMRDGVRGTVPDFALMQDATKLLSAGVQINAADFGTLTEASVILAHRGFGDTIEILDKLSTAMITGKTKTAQKMLGIIDAKGAELEYQTALDTGVDKLTAVGKAEAVRQALLEKLEGLVKSAGEQHLTFAERVAQGKTAVTNFTDSLSVAIATSPVVMSAMDSLAEAFTGALGANQAETVEMLIRRINQAGIAIVDMGIAATQTATVFIAVWGVIQTAAFATATVIWGIIAGIGEALLAAEKVAATVHLVPESEVAKIQRTQDSVRALTVESAKQTVEAGRMVVGLSAANASVDKFAGAMFVARDKMQAASDAGVKHGDVLDALGQKHQDLTRHSDKLTAAQIAWKTVVEDVESAGDGLYATIDGIDGAVVTSIERSLALGVSQSTLAKYWGLTAVQVKAVADAVTIEQQIEKTALAESLKAHDNWAKEVSKSADDVAKRIIEGANQTRTVQLKTADFLAQQTLTSTDYQVSKIWEVVREQEAAFKGTNDQRAAFNRDTEALAQAQTDALYIDTKAIETNSIASLQQTADRAWTTYQFMLDHHDQFTDRVIRNAKRAAEASQAAAEGTKTGWDRTYGALGDVGTILSNIPGKFAEIGAVAAKTGQAIMKNLADGNVWGAVIAGVTGAITVIKQLFGGVSQLELAGRKVEATFEQSFGGFQQMMTAIGGAYDATGRSAAQAQADVAALMAAEKLGGDAAKAAIDKINQAFNEQKQDAADLDTAVQKYGFSIEQLGPAMQKQKLDDQAKGLLNDWRLLVGSGIDLTVVNEKMASSVQDYLNTAMKTGQDVPAAMKPILQSMIDQGTLTDANGNKITDLGTSGITFAETMTQGFDHVVAKLQELLNKIGMVPAALAAIPTTLDVNVNGHYNAPDIPRDDNYAAIGGLVTNHGIQYLAGGGTVLAFTPRGTDTVPAMLTPGEGVVTQTGMSALGAGGLRALNRGDRSGGQVVQFSTAALERRLDQLSQALLAESRRAPERTGVAVRDALLQARVGRR